MRYSLVRLLRTSFDHIFRKRNTNDMATTIIDIECLSEVQKQALAGVKVGDFIQFQKTYAPANNNPRDAADDDDEWSDEEGDEDVEEEDEAATSAQGSDENDESDEEESNEDAEENEDTEPTSDDSNGADMEVIANSTLFYVRTVHHDSANAVTSLDIIELVYALSPSTGAPHHSFQILGISIMHADTHSDDCDCGQPGTIKQLDEQYDLSTYTIRLNPSGDDMRYAIRRQGHGLCPANCDDGWLDSLQELADVLDPAIYATAATREHSPVCPVCIGLDILKEQQDLRTTLEAFSMVQFDACHDWHARLNPRRVALGYEFYEYDEREWNLLFEDMDEEDEDGNTGGGDGYQVWAEVMDPANNIVLHPASQATITALPRKVFGELTKEQRRIDVCMICSEKHGDGDAVVELPCTHVFHAVPCGPKWLEHSEKCPYCREKVPAVQAEGKQETQTSISGTLEHSVVPNNVAAGAAGGDVEVLGDAEMDDEDMEMANALAALP